jgi:hypothetical protein
MFLPPDLFIYSFIHSITCMHVKQLPDVEYQVRISSTNKKKRVFPTDASMMMHLLPSLENLDHQVGLQKQAVAIHALPRLRGIDQDQIVPAKDL